MSDPERVDDVGWIALEGAYNARDVGGLPTTTGGRTRSGVLLRSDALDGLTVADVEHLVATVGLAHVVDLRSSAERDERGRGRLGHASITYSELQVFDADDLVRRRELRAEAHASGRDAVEIMAEGYVEILELGAPSFLAAFARMTEPGGVPALVHCAGGKDRTGVFVALLLDVAGVERSAIVADYAATAERMPALMEHLRRADQFQALAAQLPAFVFEAQAETMVAFLDHLDARWGGAASFLRANGVGDDALERWRSLLVA